MINRAVHLTRGFFDYVAEIFRSRRLILELTRREFRSRYLGSAFGLTWAFIHPSVMMLLYFLVFKYGLKAGPVGGLPFLVWLLAGLVPWMLASDCIITGSSVILDNRFLVKKVVFRVSLLPVVRLLTLLPVHLFFVLVLTIIFWGYGYPPHWENLQVFYYLAAMMFFSVGLSLLVSSLVPFLKDLAQVVSVFVQIFFWMTPIVWADKGRDLPRVFVILLNMNPLYYIVRGYRESMAEHVWLWHHPVSAAYFWILSCCLFAVGSLMFLRLKPHFADVL